MSNDTRPVIMIVLRPGSPAGKLRQGLSNEFPQFRFRTSSAAEFRHTRYEFDNAELGNNSAVLIRTTHEKQGSLEAHALQRGVPKDRVLGFDDWMDGLLEHLSAKIRDLPALEPAEAPAA